VSVVQCGAVLYSVVQCGTVYMYVHAGYAVRVGVRLDYVDFFL